MGGVVLSLGSVVGVGFAVTFGGLVPSPDRADLPGGASAVRAGFSNLYVLPAGEGRVALVDCGNETDGSSIERELLRRGLGDDAVVAILLTHGHQDHLGACRKFPHARVYAFAPEVPIIEGRATALGPVPRLRGRAPATRATHVTDILEDGELVQIGSLSVRAFLVPGHTAGSGAFLASDVLYLGDSAAAEQSGRLRGAPWIFSDDQAANVASLHRLAERLKPERDQIQAMAFGHSGPTMGSSSLFEFERR